MCKKVHFFSLLVFAAVGFTSCNNEESSKSQIIELTNQASIDLIDKAISIKKNEFPVISDKLIFPLIISQKGDTIAAQLNDLDGDDEWDELFFVVDLEANESQSYSLKWTATETSFVKRTSVRFGKRNSADDPLKPAVSETLLANQLPKNQGYQAYQTDGPTWENDKVGFRHYLDGRNSKDVFGKRVSYMSPEDVGIDANGAVEDNYHVMEEWGRDILAVGNSVGLGGIALISGDQLLRLGVTVNDSINNVEETNFKILAEGPVKSVINFNYKNWKPFGHAYNAEETVSIMPGMYAYHSSVKLSNLNGGEELAVGLVNINNDNGITEILDNDKWVALVTHDKQSYDKEWWLGLALILPKDVYLGYIDAPKTGNLSHTYLAKLKLENNKEVDYYSVAAWELSDEGFVDKDYFRNYVQSLIAQLSAEVSAVVK